MSHQGYTTALRGAVEKGNLGVVSLERLRILHGSRPSRVHLHRVVVALNIGEVCSIVGINLYLMMMSKGNAHIACDRELPALVLASFSTCKWLRPRT